MRRHGRWRVRLAEAAEADLHQILRWTAENFGETQAISYAGTLMAAIDALAEGPRILGARSGNEIAKGLMILHVARSGRRGRHFIMYRANGKVRPPTIDVLRILHDATDLARHIDPDPEANS